MAKDNDQQTALLVLKDVVNEVSLTPAQKERLTNVLVDEVVDFVGNPYRHLITIIFTIGAVWGLITTALGCATMLGISPNIPAVGQAIALDNIFQPGSIVAYVSGLIAGALLFALSLFTRQLWSRGGCAFTCFKIIWFFGLLFNFYASVMGNAQYVILGTTLSSFSDVFQYAKPSQIAVIGMLSLTTSISPIIVSYTTRRSLRREMQRKV